MYVAVHVLRILYAKSLFSAAMGNPMHAHADTAGSSLGRGLVVQLQDKLASGLAMETVAAGVEAVVSTLRQAVRDNPGEVRQLLNDTHTALAAELSQSMLEDRKAGAAELEGLRQKFNACKYRTGDADGVGKADIGALTISHKDCRNTEADALQVFTAKCDTARLNTKPGIQVLTDADTTSSLSPNCQKLARDYQQRQAACNTIQDQLDSSVCMAKQTSASCSERLACEAKVHEAMHTALETIEVHDREFFGLTAAKSLVSCLTTSLGNGEETAEEALKACEKQHRPQTDRRMEYSHEASSLPEMTPCRKGVSLLEQEQEFGSSTGIVLDYGDLPREAPPKACSSSCCFSLLQKESQEFGNESNHEDHWINSEKPPPFTLTGCTSWYKSEEAAIPWLSSIGSIQGVVIDKRADALFEAGSGSSGKMKFVRGDENTTFDFGPILSETYTICSATRYWGAPYRRILQGSQSNWIHGHVNGSAAVSCAGQPEQEGVLQEDWAVVCATSDESREVIINGKVISSAACRPQNVKQKQNLVVNHGQAWGERSKWAVAEIITWNRVLSTAEMATAGDYLNKKIKAGIELDLKITGADGTCNGKRVQVLMAPKEPQNGWWHSPELGDPHDRSSYQIQDSTFGSFKILKDPLPIVSERSNGEVNAPWGHSSLKGTAFVFVGNNLGPKMLSFFGIDADVTVRVTANGTDHPDVSVAYGATAFLDGNFANSRVKIMATHNILAAMSGPSGQFSTPLGPAAKSIYGILRDNWYVTNLKGEVANVVRECWDGTSQNYTSNIITADVGDKQTVASLLETASNDGQRASMPGWFLLNSTSAQKTCTQTCALQGLNCSTDASLLSSEKKLNVVARSLGFQCSSIQGPYKDTEAPTVAGVNGTCKFADESSPLSCDAQAPDAGSRICYCSNPTANDDYYTLAAKDSNACPTGYMPISTAAACRTAATLGTMPGVPGPIAWSSVDPNNKGSPSGCFKNLDTGDVHFNSISFTDYASMDSWQTADHRKICKNIKLLKTAEPICKFTAVDDQVFLGGVSYDFTGSSAVTFLPPGVFQSETKLPMDTEQVKLVSAQENTCKVKGRKYQLYGKDSVFQGHIPRKLKAEDVISCKQPVMAVGYRDMGEQGIEAPRLNLLSATACKAASKRGVQGLQVDTTLYLEHGFVFTKVLEKKANGDIFTIPEADFNENLQPYSKYPLVKRVCPSCAASHTEILYRRFNPAGDLSLYKTLACAWNPEPGNNISTDFKLFSNLNDALADENAWTSCNFALKDTGRGFPFECGPRGSVPDQWNSIAVDGTSASGKCTQDVEAGGRPVTFFMLLPMVPQEWRFAMKIENSRVTTIPESEFNRRFQQSRYHIIIRRCQECARSYRHVVYRRFTQTDAFEPYKSLACDWKEGDTNTFMIDFKLYSSVQDALTDNNAWQVCKFNGSGFPGQCKPNAEVNAGDQTSYIRVAGCAAGTSSKSVTFEIYEDVPVNVAEIDTDDVDALAAANSRDAQLPEATPPDEGMVSWFRSEDAGPTWTSVIGPYSASVAGGFVGTSERYYGSDLKHIWGDSRAIFNFGNIVPASTFTVCSVTAYTGVQQGQILRSEGWWHGHNAGQAGSVYYKGWVRNELNQSGVMKWLTVCASNQHEKVFVDGQELPASFVGKGGGVTVGINDGSISDRSDWAVAEVITWDRVLSQSEMISAQNYLRAKVKTCQPEQNAQCDSPPCVSLFVGPNRHNVMFRNEDGSATVRTETGQDVSCVCVGFCVGLVGVWKCEGGPYGGQYSISSDYQDDWTSETDKDSLLLCSAARPSWFKKMEITSSDLPMQLGATKDHIQNTSFSLVAAIRRTSDMSAGAQTIFASEGTGASNDKLRFQVNEDKSFSVSFGGKECRSKQISEDGVWQHLVFVFDMQKMEGRLYLNGLEVMICSNLTTFLSTTDQLVLGAAGSALPWNGDMKDMGVYPEALHKAMVYRLANDLAMNKTLVWFSYQDNWSRKSYVQAVSFCAKRNMKLAKYEDYCGPTSEGNFTVKPRAAAGDQWAPFAGGKDNSWVQIGDGSSSISPTPTCKTYEDQFGKTPGWGTDGRPRRYKSYLACKSMFNFILFESDKGKGSCAGGTNIPVDDPVVSAEACKMQCVKQASCSYATWTPADTGGACRVSSSCDAWVAKDGSTTWVKKPLR
eukprot:TRINITY_DN1437_c0_g1_i1.p1 TRINITY_DN1437_c0_g1~~TRINITY_DN1437_c0_g1_i1.p1  ORF type:complete len:2162 (-),score=335.88 TRINITY_DN1437_c0_g1_i1:98-6583(-)